MRGLLPAAIGIALSVSAPERGLGADDSTFFCEPALKFYCANIHVGCAGRSKLPTEAFTLTFQPPDAVATFPNGAEYRGPVVFSFRKEDATLILRNGRDWIRIEPDGVFSQRIYRKSNALMARGSCDPKNP